MRIKLHIQTVLIVLFVAIVKLSVAQNEMLYSSSVVGDEIVNPAYNSINAHPVMSLMRGEQWVGKFEGSPEITAANLYLPVNRSGLGLSANLVGEKIGLRTNTLVNVNISQKIKLSKVSFLALGIGVGLQKNNFKKSGIVSNSGLSGFDMEIYNENFGQVNIGILYKHDLFYCGLSSNTLIYKINNSSKLLPGIDFTLGTVIRTPHIKIFPKVGYTHYKMRESITLQNETKVLTDKVSVVKLACNFVYNDIIQIGVEHRFNRFQSFSMDVIIKNKLKAGFIYDIGIGGGINKFNSQGVRLSYDFSPRRMNRKSLMKKMRFSVL